ncbi:MAG: outer membrane beta-barrel protein [Polyangiaceae bacterium]
MVLSRCLPAVAATLLLCSGEARADTPAESKAPSAEAVLAALPFTLSGYVEGFYSWNFNAPSNGITNYRGFDDRHNAFTLSNVALDALWDRDDLLGRLTLQIGSTPSTYYLGEPPLPGTGAASASGPDTWKYLQQAYAGYRIPVGRGLSVTAGLFLSPIGPESIAVKDDWAFSRSNLFFGLPFYHTGVRVAYPLTDAWVVSLHGFNGWNSVVDNNDEKSVCAQIAYARPDVAFSFLYFGGVERPRDAPEGRAWRHLFDAHVTWSATPRLSLQAHADAGFEKNRFGTSGWAAGAVAARVKLHKVLYLAARGDAFFEEVADNSLGRAAPLFWPAPWVSSGTATADLRPHDRVSFRLEYRHDHAGANMFFGGAVATDATTGQAAPNRTSQDTVTLGATSWF